IASLTPNSGPTGTSVTVGGSGFGTPQGNGTITFNGVTATPTAWTDTSITAPVPGTATTGPVVVRASGVNSNGMAFSVQSATGPIAFVQGNYAVPQTTQTIVTVTFAQAQT